MSLLASFLLVFQSLFPSVSILVASRVYAQEETPTVTETPAATPTPEPPVSPTSEETPAPTQEATPTPKPTLTTTPTQETTPTPTVNQTPTVVPTPTEEAIATPSPKVATPTPTEVVQPTETGPPEIGQILDGASTTAASTATPLWQFLDSVTDVTTEAVLAGKEYRFRNTPVTVTFTTLPQPAGTLTIKEIKLTKEQQDSVGAFSDTAYDITSDMVDGTFTYDLTLPIPDSAKGKQIKVKASESVDQLPNSQIVPEEKDIKSDTITIKGLNHFTIFYLSADTNAATGTGAYTSNTEPIITETAEGQIKTGTVILNVPSGFTFNTSSNVTASVGAATSGSCSSTSGGNKVLKLGTGAGASTQTSTPTTTTITFNVKTKSKGNTCKITFAGIQARPTDGTPLASGDITISGTADISSATLTGATLTEVAGVVSAGVSTVGASPSSVAADNSATSTVTVTLKDAFGNPISGKTVTLAKTSGPGSPTITTVSDTTNASGQASFTVKSSTVGTDVFTATDTTDSTTVTQTASVSFTDVTAPTAPGTPSTTTPTNNNQPTWTWTAATDNVAVDHYIFYWDTVLGGEANSSGSLSAATLDFTHSTPLADGTWYAKVRAYDAASNNTFSGNGSVVIDTTVPTLSQITLVPSPTNNNTPDYTFNSSEDGTISYGGDCASDTTVASAGDNTITFNTLADGTHSNCTITVTDAAGNPSSPLTVSSFTVDTTAPTTTIDSPAENSFWNTPIVISGSSSDTTTGVSYVRLFYRSSGIEENPWTEIPDSQQDNEDGDEPFSWSFSWTPPTDGQFDIKAEATDNAGNTELSPVVEYVTYDVTPPVDPSVSSTSHTTSTWSADPTIDMSWSGASDATAGVAGYSYLFDTSSATLPDHTSEGAATSTTSDPLADGNSNYFHLSTADNAGNWTSTVHVGPFLIDTTAPATPSANPPAGDYTSDQSVTLSSSDASSGLAAIYYTIDGSTPDNTKTLYTGPITADRDMTIKAIAYDNAGNGSGILSATYGIPPHISTETASTVSSTSVTVTWTTDDPSTSRVIYDTASHPVLAEAPNYGYASSTVEADTVPKVTSHSVVVSGLTAGTTYYYRTVSHGSPEAVGDELSFTTSSAGGGGGGGGGGGDGGAVLGAATAPVCGDTKPAGVPTLLSATAGANSVTLTWTEGNDPISYYLVTYGTSRGAQTYGNPNIGGKGTTSYTVSGLSGGTTYYFRVRAGNGCAPGDYSGELSATPTGGFVSGIPGGFSAGVLGGATSEEATGSATPSGEVTPTPEVGQVLGGQNGGIPWWVYLVIGGLILLVAVYLSKKHEG